MTILLRPPRESRGPLARANQQSFRLFSMIQSYFIHPRGACTRERSCNDLTEQRSTPRHEITNASDTHVSRNILDTQSADTTIVDRQKKEIHTKWRRKRDNAPRPLYNGIIGVPIKSVLKFNLNVGDAITTQVGVNSRWVLIKKKKYVGTKRAWTRWNDRLWLRVCSRRSTGTRSGLFTFLSRNKHALAPRTRTR